MTALIEREVGKELRYVSPVVPVGARIITRDGSAHLLQGTTMVDVRVIIETEFVTIYELVPEMIVLTVIGHDDVVV